MTFIIGLFKHDRKAREKARKLDDETSPKMLSVVTVHEVLRGLFYIGKEEKVAEGEKP